MCRTSRLWSCIALLLFGAVAEPSAAAAESSWHRHLTDADGASGRLTIVLPFYEGVLVERASSSLVQARMSDVHFAYPGVLSVPFIAWRYGARTWQAAYVTELGAAPAELAVASDGTSVDVVLRSFTGAPIKTLEVTGDVRALASALRARWKVRGSGASLATRFDRVNFYVHQFVSTDRTPPLQMNWDVPALVNQMQRESPRSMQFVYGIDPSGVDLGGEYFWSDGAVAKVRQILGANRQLAHLNWLNLRTWKRAIPALGIERPIDDQVKAMRKVLPPGSKDEEGQFQSKSLSMCLASEGWQRSRLEQFDRLADLGFKVIQIDEFPIPAFWHTMPCQAAGHGHRPNDIVDEWRRIDDFLRVLAERARRRGILLTSEEPSAALIPYVAGYIDREFNDQIDLYSQFRATGTARPIPFFSAMFGDLVTPYTDADEAEPARQPPPGWLKQHKLYPPKKDHH